MEKKPSKREKKKPQLFPQMQREKNRVGGSLLFLAGLLQRKSGHARACHESPIGEAENAAESGNEKNEPN